jgi:hypothetical protein
MNCKPGDLAVIINNPFPENIGKFVTVIKLANPENFYGGKPGDFCWECESATEVRVFCDDEGKTSVMAKDEFCMDDFELKPIRDNDGEDEMIRIAGKPEKEIA